MFDHDRQDPFLASQLPRPHLAPDLLRHEHIQRLRQRDAAARASVWPTLGRWLNGHLRSTMTRLRVSPRPLTPLHLQK